MWSYEKKRTEYKLISNTPSQLLKKINTFLVNSITKLQPATAFRNVSLSPDFSGLALIKKKKRINVTKQKSVEKKNHQ